MPYPNEHAARIRPPGAFKNIVQLKKLSNGIRILGGSLKDGGKTETQAYRFPVSKFTAKEAKQWLKDHDIKYTSFEAASDSSEASTEISMENKLVLAKEGKKGKLSIIGNVGWDYFGISYQTFKNQLADLGELEQIDVDITSPGGIVTDGVAIMNALMAHPATIHTYINGQAASIASVIAMAGDEIFIYDNSLMFVHKPLNMTIGNADDMRKRAEDLDKFEKAMLAAYKRHFKGSEDEMKALMKAETWLTADEVADKFGSVTIIESGEAKAAAHGEPLAIFGNPEDYSEEMLAFSEELTEDTDLEIEACMKDETFKGLFKGLLAHLKRPKPNKQEKDMALKPEEKAELVAEITAAVTAALKPAEAPVAVVAPVVEAPAPVVAEITFEGDMDKPEDVQAHAAKLQKAQLKAAVDWNDPASVMAYHKAIAPAPAAAVPGSNTAPAAAPVVVAVAPALTPEAIKAEVDAINAHRRITGK